MITWKWWKIRRSEASTAPQCLHCRVELASCDRCEGAWLDRRCPGCCLGWTCASHGSHWLV